MSTCKKTQTIKTCSLVEILHHICVRPCAAKGSNILLCEYVCAKQSSEVMWTKAQESEVTYVPATHSILVSFKGDIQQDDSVENQVATKSFPTFVFLLLHYEFILRFHSIFYYSCVCLTLSQRWSVCQTWDMSLSTRILRDAMSRRWDWDIKCWKLYQLETVPTVEKVAWRYECREFMLWLYPRGVMTGDPVTIKFKSSEKCLWAPNVDRTHNLLMTSEILSRATQADFGRMTLTAFGFHFFAIIHQPMSVTRSN